MATVITALVLDKQDIQYVNNEQSVGSIQSVPTPDGGAVVDGDVWAIPVNDGVYAGWQFLPYNPSNAEENTAPDAFSVRCTKLSSSVSSDWWIVLGTSAAYVVAAAGGTALPIVWPSLIHTSDLLPVCQTIANQDQAGNYVASIGLPTIAGGTTYYPFGWLTRNGVTTALTTASSSGYSTSAALLSFLNSGTWANVGTWTKTSDDLTVIATQTAGSGTDIFCGGIIAITPSL